MAAAKITATSLTRRFGEVTAVDDVDLEIGDGRWSAFSGRAGAARPRCYG